MQGKLLSAIVPPTSAIVLLIALLLAACQSTGRGPDARPAASASGGAPSPANTIGAASSHGEPAQEVQRLVAAAAETGETELNISWSANSLGGIEAASRFEVLFNLTYGTNIKILFTPGPSMPDMAGKIAQELAAGRKASSDLYLGSANNFAALLPRYVLESYDYGALSPGVRPSMVAPHNIGVQIYGSVPGIIYNTDFIAAAEAPRKLEDVLNPRWKGRIASTQNASYFNYVAAHPEWGTERVKAFLARLSDHVGGLIRAGEEERVMSGEFILTALENGQNVRQARTQGAPVEFVAPEDGTIVQFTYLGVPRNSAHPNLAKLFINLILTEAGQRTLYEVRFADHYRLPGSRSALEPVMN
jgi:ABC-type Fe3+ transport system substrate-binding protein